MREQSCMHTWHQTPSQHDPTGLHILNLIDHWQGPTAAVITCFKCQVPGIIWMQAWSGQHNELRIFSMALLQNKTVQIFMENQDRAFCDLSRRDQELKALLASAELCHLLFELDINTGEMTKTLACNNLSRISYQSWQKGLPNQAYWQHCFASEPGLLQSNYRDR